MDAVTPQVETNVDAVQVTIVRILAGLLFVEPAEIKADLPFSAAGVDSILAVEFIDDLSTAFSGKISQDTIYQYPTVGQLAAYLAAE